MRLAGVSVFILLLSFNAFAGESVYKQVFESGEIRCKRKPNAPVIAVPAASVCGRERGGAPKSLCTMQIVCVQKDYLTKNSGESVSVTEGVATCMGEKAFNPEAKKAVDGCPEANECIRDTRVETRVVMTNSDLGGAPPEPSAGSGAKAKSATSAR